MIWISSNKKRLNLKQIKHTKTSFMQRGVLGLWFILAIVITFNVYVFLKLLFRIPVSFRRKRLRDAVTKSSRLEADGVARNASYAGFTLLMLLKRHLTKETFSQVRTQLYNSKKRIS